MDLSRSVDKVRLGRIKAEIRVALMDQWDPIGVKYEPQAADEYDGYLSGVYGLLMDGASDSAISDYLRDIEIKRMGFSEHQVPDRLEVVTTLKRISLD